MGFIEQYGALMASALISLGSIGVVPYFVEGIIIFSIILLISLVLLLEHSKKVYLDGFLYSILAGVSLIFGFHYMGGNFLSVILGMIYFISVPSMMYIAITRFKDETST